MSLERIVRPFETPRFTLPQRVFTPYEQTAQNVSMTFGRSGSGKPMNGSYTARITVYMDTRLVEETA